MKKIISIVLTIAMLASGVIFTGAAATETEAQAEATWYNELLVADFSGTSLPAGWNVSGDSAIVAIENGTLAFTSTADKNADVYYNLPDTITSGIVTVQYKVKADAVNKLSVSLQDSDWETAGGTQTNLPSFLADGNIAREKVGGTIFSSDSGTENTWVTVAVRVDLNRKEATQTMINESGKLLYVDTFGWGRWLAKRNEADAESTLSKVKSIGFEIYAGDGTGATKNYVDDVKLVYIPNRTDELMFDYDFENAESIADVYSYGTNFWEGANTDSYEIGNDAVQGKTMVHKASGMYLYNIPSRDGKSGNSGVSQIDFKIKPTALDSAQVIQLGGELNRAAMNTDNLVLQGGNGSFKIGNKIDAGLYSVPFEANQWYDVSVIVNAPMKNYTVAIAKDGKELIRRGGMPLTLSTHNPGYLLFRRWGGSAYEIDDISAKEITEYRVFSDSFDSYETVSGGANAITDMAKSGWQNHDVNSNPGGELVTENGNKAWSYNGKNGDLGFKFPSVVAQSGKVRVNLSMKFAADTIAMAELMDSSTTYGSMLAQVCYNRMATYHSGSDTEEQVLIRGYDPNKWYDYNIIVDYDTKTYTVGVSADGKEITRRKMALMDFGEATAQNNLHKIGFRHWGGGAVYVDDISIDVISQLSDTDKVITNEDFTDVTADNDNLRGWSSYYSESHPLEYGVTDEAHGNSAILPEDEAKGAGIKKYVFAKDGAVKLSYDLKTNGAKVMANAVTVGGKETGLGFFDSNGDIYHTQLGAAEGYRLCTIDPNEWIKVETIIDIEKMLYTYIIKDEEGNIVHKEIVYGFKNMTNVTADVDATVQYLGFRNWTADKPVYVDNFKLEYYNDTESPSMIYNVMTGGRRVTLADYENGADATLWFFNNNAENANKEYSIFAAYYDESGALANLQKVADGEVAAEIEEVSYPYSVPSKQNIGKVKFFAWYSDGTIVPAGKAYTIDK